MSEVVIHFMSFADSSLAYSFSRRPQRQPNLVSANRRTLRLASPQRHRSKHRVDQFRRDRDNGHGREGDRSEFKVRKIVPEIDPRFYSKRTALCPLRMAQRTACSRLIDWSTGLQ